MRLKNVIPLFFSSVIGISFAFLLFHQYEDLETLEAVGNFESKTVYFLQQGVYSTKESMEQNTTFFSDYIYEEKDGMFYVYIGITSSEELAEKIKEYYTSKGYSLYRKSFEVGNPIFLTELEKLEESFNESSIPTFLKKVLIKYKELVVDVKDEGITQE